MKQTIRNLAIATLILTHASGCATAPVNDGQEVIDTEQGMSPKLKRALFIGGAVLAGALLVSEAEDSAQDAVRSVTSP